MVKKVFEKVVNNSLVGHLGLFSDIQYGFRSFWSTADLLTIVSDRIARSFWNFWRYSSHSTWYIQCLRLALACWSSSQNILGKLAYSISILQKHISPFLSNIWLCSLGSILGLTLFLPHIHDLPDDAIYNIVTFNVEKCNSFCLITQVQLRKWMGIFFRKSNLLRYWDCLSFLNWFGALTPISSLQLIDTFSL